MAFPRLFQGFRSSTASSSSGGGGGGAPADAEFIVLGLDSHLTAERVLTGESSVIDLTDNGPESTLVISIHNGGITFAKLQNIPTNTLIGRSTAGTGSPESITVGSGLTLAAGVLAATGGGGGSNVGVATLDFGPNTSREVAAQVDVTGQTTITAMSVILVAVRVEATSDHTADEVRIENLKTTVGDIVPGVGFTIYGEIQLGKTYGHFDVNWSWS